VLQGFVDHISRERVQGWAADTDRPDEPVEILIHADGQRLARLRCDRPRADLARLSGFGRGNHGFRLDLRGELPAALETRITVRFAATGETLAAGEAVLASEAGSAGLAPVLVTGLARSGTTLLMRRLAGFPQICLAELAPFEVRLLSYYATAHRILTAPGDFDASTHPDRLEGDGFFVGFNPFHSEHYQPAFQEARQHRELFRGFAAARVRDAFRDTIREYYARLSADQGKPAVRYFAEKGNNLDEGTRRFTRLVFPETREVVLFRDPRDQLCSYRSWFHLSHEAAFAMISDGCASLLRIREQRAASVLFLRYEDLVADPAGSLATLAGFLGLPAPGGADAAAERAMFGDHGTSASPADSVGRWRTELTAEEIDQCDRAWSGTLEALGYPLSGAVQTAPRPIADATAGRTTLSASPSAA
jgi:hypothetical protein